jgi:hypothetical protein
MPLATSASCPVANMPGEQCHFVRSAPVQLEGVVQVLQPLRRQLITAVDDPPAESEAQAVRQAVTV